jgi:RNA polymerase sigma factor (sigma-70 family)
VEPRDKSRTAGKGPEQGSPDTGAVSDGDAIAASRSEPEWFAVIFDRHVEAIHSYLQRRVGPTPADDLAAETFLVAFRSRRSYDVSRSNAAPWLFGIATNLVRHLRRRERRELRAYARTGIDPVRDETDQAESRVDSTAAGPQLAKAVASLSSKDREVLLLYAWAELSYGEIADALAIPVGTVRSRLARARRKVRELLSANGQLPGEGPGNSEKR